jgi:hypothetical protein
MEAKLNGPHPRCNRTNITPLRLFSGEPPVQPIRVGMVSLIRLQMIVPGDGQQLAR